MKAELTAANQGATNRLGLNFQGQLDTSRIGYFGYSRSGSLVSELLEPLAASGTRIASIASYGAAYPVPDEESGNWGAPLPADIPAFEVIGLADDDVDSAPAMYGAKYLAQERTAPHLIAMPATFGHAFIDRELSSRGVDDRNGCDQPGFCADAATHERFMSNALPSWFATTLKREANDLFPMSDTAPLPEKLGDTAVDWLVNPGTKRTIVLDSEQASQQAPATTGEGSQSERCRFVSPMNPQPPSGSCQMESLLSPIDRDDAVLTHLGTGGTVNVPEARRSRCTSGYSGCRRAPQRRR